MKFTVEITKTLHGYNADGSKVALQEGDEAYFKIDLSHMNLWDKEKWIQTYPDGWVKGIIHHVSNAGTRIELELFDYRTNYLLLTQSNILDVSDKAPKEAQNAQNF